MTSTFDYSKINKNNSELGAVTLRQGIKFKKYQSKITKNVEKKNLLFEGFQGLEGNLSQNDYSSLESKQAIENTHRLISQTDNTVTNQLQELDALQNKFNTILEQYNGSNTALMNSTKSFVQTYDSNDKKNTNVYVNKMLNDSLAKYVNIFNNTPNPNVMTMMEGEYNYDSCKSAAENNGYKFFGLNNANSQTQNANCLVSNSQSEYSANGSFISRCNKGSDSFTYGGPWTNAIYSTSGNSFKYLGCYADGPDRAMTMSGPDMSKYSSVYVLGNSSIGPWGNSNFPDTNASWIWYTPDAQNGAPDNSGAPTTFIYAYNYDGTNYVNATIFGMCDDNSIIYLNSQKIGEINGGWDQNPIEVPITIAPGMNYIEVSAYNTGGPAGLIMTIMIGDQVLLNTNSDWKYTNESISNLTPGGQQFSVSTCQKYASSNGYSYFGLQNGLNGNSQCMVSNDLNTSTKYGSADGSVKLNDGNIYGLKDTISVYKLDNVGNSKNMGKVGYVNEDSLLAEYPDSMFSIDPDTNMPIINNNISCSKKVIGIDTLEWNNFVNTGVPMSNDTVCGLEKATENENINRDALKVQLSSIADQIVNKITYLQSLNSNLNNQMGIDKTVLDKNLMRYKTLSKQYNQYKNEDSTNINGILTDSDIVLLQENYSYLFWSILAIAIITITINIFKK